MTEKATFWDAVNEYVRARNGDLSRTDLSVQAAVVQVERAVEALLEESIHPPLEDRGPWMQLYPSGKAFYLLDPQPEDFTLEDIAQGLAHECRYNGQCRFPWSVAQHSIAVAYEVQDRAARLPEAHSHVMQLFLLGLLHDAEEAFIKDIHQPLKRSLLRYGRIQEGVRRAINLKFGLEEMVLNCQPFLYIIKSADLAVLKSEKAVLHVEEPQPWPGLDSVTASSQPVYPETIASARSRWLYLVQHALKWACWEFEGVRAIFEREQWEVKVGDRIAFVQARSATEAVNRATYKPGRLPCQVRPVNCPVWKHGELVVDDDHRIKVDWE